MEHHAFFFSSAIAEPFHMTITIVHGCVLCDSDGQVLKKKLAHFRHLLRTDLSDWVCSAYTLCLKKHPRCS